MRRKCKIEETYGHKMDENGESGKSSETTTELSLNDIDCCLGLSDFLSFASDGDAVWAVSRFSFNMSPTGLSGSLTTVAVISRGSRKISPLTSL